MTFEYNYSREKITSGEFEGLWNIDNPARIDQEGQQIRLVNESSEGLSIAHVILICNEEGVKFIFDQELTPEQKTQLDSIVYNHKMNI